MTKNDDDFHFDKKVIKIKSRLTIYWGGLGKKRLWPLWSRDSTI